jgi:membrane-associated phospholipid phosphatase
MKHIRFAMALLATLGWAALFESGFYIERERRLDSAVFLELIELEMLNAELRPERSLLLVTTYLLAAFAAATILSKRTGLGDGNPDTIGDTNFTPLGAPASNLNGPNFTPPFPAYPSGHAGFGGALFQVMRRFYGTDNIVFTFVSDEFNGQTRDNNGNIRPYRPRSFSTLSQAEEENGQSRIYLGIHWSFDKTEGIALGRRVGDYVFDQAFTPVHP